VIYPFTVGQLSCAVISDGQMTPPWEPPLAAFFTPAAGVPDRELHAAIARATKNPLLGNLSRQLRAQISLGFEAEPYSAAIRQLAIEQHALLVQAVIERRPEEAARLAAIHFSLTEDAIRKLLGRVRR